MQPTMTSEPGRNVASQSANGRMGVFRSTATETSCTCTFTIQNASSRDRTEILAILGPEASYSAVTS
jgi:hypothetical protein